MRRDTRHVTEVSGGIILFSDTPVELKVLCSNPLYIHTTGNLYPDLKVQINNQVGFYIPYMIVTCQFIVGFQQKSQRNFSNRMGF